MAQIKNTAFFHFPREDLKQSSRYLSLSCEGKAGFVFWLTSVIWTWQSSLSVEHCIPRNPTGDEAACSGLTLNRKHALQKTHCHLFFLPWVWCTPTASVVETAQMQANGFYVLSALLPEHLKILIIRDVITKYLFVFNNYNSIKRQYFNSRSLKKDMKKITR